MYIFMLIQSGEKTRDWSYMITENKRRNRTHPYETVYYLFYLGTRKGLLITESITRVICY